LVRVLEASGAEVIVVAAEGRTGIRQAPWERSMFALAHSIHDLVDQSPVFAVWALSHESAVAASIALADDNATKLITTYSEVATEHFPFGRSRAEFAYTLPRIDLHIALSETYRAIAAERGAASTRLMMNPLGFDVDAIRSGDARTGRDLLQVGPNDTVVFCPSRFSERKGQLVLLDAWEAVGQHGEVLVLAGSGHSAESAYVEKLRSRVASWSGQAAVQLLEDGVARLDIPHALAAARTLVQPSFFEGLGYSALEGMAAGIPCVLTDAPGFDTFADPGTNCLVVPPRDAAALGKALRVSLDDDSVRRRLSQGGRATGAQFSLVENLRAVLERAGASHREGRPQR
jgi:glycosyltransferase involved in cell wall biosynthesis